MYLLEQLEISEIETELALNRWWKYIANINNENATYHIVISQLWRRFLALTAELLSAPIPAIDPRRKATK